jgi:transcriptional regulator GlxA family with amidase domain
MRLFHTELNVNPAELVDSMRFDLARRALLESREMIEAIAHTCGFGSLRRMDRAFARAASTSPCAYNAPDLPAGQSNAP